MRGGVSADANASIGFVQRVLMEANKNPNLELENKFGPRFQGIVSEDASAFMVGTEAQTFQELQRHFDVIVSEGKLTREKLTETVQYLSDQAFAVCGSQLQSCPLIAKYGRSVRVVSSGSQGPRMVLIKQRLPLPDSKSEVFPEGFKMSLADEHFIDVEAGDDLATQALQVLNLFQALPSQMIVSRRKERTSYIQHLLDSHNNSVRVLKIDFTITRTSVGSEAEAEADNLSAVVSNQDDSASGDEGDTVNHQEARGGDNVDCRFEIEMEYIGNKTEARQAMEHSPQLLTRVAKLFLQNTLRLICLIQGSDMPLTVVQHNRVVCHYMELVGLTDKDDPYRDHKFKFGTDESQNWRLFVGCQPESLHERHLPQLVRDGYFVMDKTDGERWLLLAVPRQQDDQTTLRTELQFFLINRWMHVKKAGITVTVDLTGTTEGIGVTPSSEAEAQFAAYKMISTGFLIDGELIDQQNPASDDAEGLPKHGSAAHPKGAQRYMAFDVLWAGGNNVRPKITYRRLECLKQIIGMLNNPRVSKKSYSGRLPQMNIEIKQYLHWPRGQAASGDLIRQMLQRDYPVDGLIFTPDMAYPSVRKWEQLLKWKGKQSTVDLFVKRNDSQRCWDLYVNGNFATMTRERQRCLIFKRVHTSGVAATNDYPSRTSTNQHHYWVVTEDGLIMQQSSRDLKQAKMRSAILFPFVPSIPLSAAPELEDEMVYEFCWNHDSQRLIPMHKRVDKSLQGISGANALSVAVDVWESMKYPVTQEQLMALPLIEMQPDKPNTVGTYPYVKDIHPNLDWKMIFEMASSTPTTTTTTGGGNRGKSKSCLDIEQHAMRQLHNRIKSFAIRSVTQTKRKVTDAERLSAMGGVIITQRGEDSVQRLQHGVCWSLPMSAVQLLETEWGIDVDDCIKRGERIHVYEHVLKRHKAKLQIEDNAKVIVDLCCGRGGDLMKYIKYDVDIVIGIDNVPELLYGNKDGALKRWMEHKFTQPEAITGSQSDASQRKQRKSSQSHTDACFVLADVRQPLYDTILQKRGIGVQADVVCCFFALHYFFSCERDARSFFQNVKDLLRDDGYFIGTIIDGRLMYEKLRQNDNVYARNDPRSPIDLFRVTATNFDATTTAFEDLPDYGAAIDVDIYSSILDQYTGLQEKDGELKQENLVKFDHLISLANDYDLEFQVAPTFDQYFPENANIQLSEGVAQFSALHRNFCFRKISRSKGTHSFQELKEQVRFLQEQQIHSGVVEDDRMINMYACDTAYPDDALVRRFSDAEAESQSQSGSDYEDEQQNPRKRSRESESEADEPDQEHPVDDEAEGAEPEDEENGDEDEAEGAEQDEDEDEVDEEDEAKAEEQPELTIKGCSSRCKNGECKYCYCKKQKQRCTDACGCGPSCKNG